MPIGGGTSSANLAVVRTGAFAYFAHANDPGNTVGEYLECNGQNVSRTTYATLFASIGITWGAGDGTTTFTLPDARRRAPVGKGGVGTGTLGATVGSSGGAETHTLTVAQLASHTHTQEAINADGTYAGAGGGNPSGGVSSTGSAGGDTAHNNMQPSYICGVWIKT